jgi:hypothetical protein
MGLAARRGVEADYSVSAWSGAFVHSLTGGAADVGTVAAPVLDRDRPEPSAGGRSSYEPNAARVRAAKSLKLVGDPQ